MDNVHFYFPFFVHLNIDFYIIPKKTEKIILLLFTKNEHYYLKNNKTTKYISILR